MPISIA